MSVARLPRLIRQRSDAAAWDLVHALPDPRLAPYVLEYVGYDEWTLNLAVRHEVPTPKCVLVINFGAPFEVAYPQGDGAWVRCDSFVAGLGEQPALNRSTGLSSCLQVNLSPLGARLLLGLRMDELSNRTADLMELMGADGWRLAAQLREAPDWAARCNHFDRLLLQRLAGRNPLSRLAGWAYGRLAASAGTAAIGRLAVEAGVSRKHLVATFRSEIGVPPKTLARMLRFERVLALLDQAARPDLAGLALDAGYYDQAHFTRDFRALAGLTPLQYLRRRQPAGPLLAGADAR